MSQAVQNGSKTHAAPAMPVHPQPIRLSRRQKAAIIVRLLLKEGANLSLADLPEAMQVELTHEMGAMRRIDRDTLNAVVGEFVAEVKDLGIAFPGGLEGALDTLQTALSPDCLRRIRQETGVQMRGDPWALVAKADVVDLVNILRAESVEIAAVILSKLPVPRSAEILGRLPGDLARRITYAVSATGGVAPETVRTIGHSIAEQLDARTPDAFDVAPVARLGAILNSSKEATRADILTGLDETDEMLAGQVRRTIFTFSDIPSRIEAKDVPKVVRAVDPKLLVVALAAAPELYPEAGDYLLENMSQRLATQLREDVAEAPRVKPIEREAALAAIVAAIREMEAAGELVMIEETEEENA